MTAAVCITVAALIYVCVLSPTVAVLVGRATKLRDTQTPPTGMPVQTTPGRRAQDLHGYALDERFYGVIAPSFPEYH